MVKPASDGHRKGVSKKMKVAIEPWDGRVDVKLFWETGADLNLILSDPNGRAYISAAEPGPTQSGGEFNADSTSGCGGPGSFEQITWPQEDALTGFYYGAVQIADPMLCDGDETPEWRLEIRVNGKLVQSLRDTGFDDPTFEFGEGVTW